MPKNPFDPKWTPSSQTPKVKTTTKVQPVPVYTPYNTSAFPSPYSSPMNMPVWNGSRDAADYAYWQASQGVPANTAPFALPNTTGVEGGLTGMAQANQASGVLPPGYRGGWNTGTAQGLSTGEGGGGFPYWQQSDEQKAATNAYWAEQAANDKVGWTPEQQAAYINTYYGENGSPRPGDPYQVFPYWKYDGPTSISNTRNFPTRFRQLENGNLINKSYVPGTNKIYDSQLPEGMENPTTKNDNLNTNIPSWVGSLVNWRT